MKKNYLFKARMLLSASMLFLGAWSAHAQFPAPYCPAAFSNGMEPITLVNFGSINNTTAAAIAPATSPAVMQDFTAMNTTVTPTVAYPITLKGNSDGNWVNFYRVYVDWNNDNDFDDADESYNIGTITASTGVDNKQVSGTILVPATATAGNRRMRVVKKYDAYGTACNTDGYGQTEDYTLIVTAPPACISPSGVVLSGSAGANTANITWVAPNPAPSNGYEVYVSSSNTPPTATTQGVDASGTSASLNNLTSSTVQYVWVRSDCGNDTYSAWSQVFTFLTACDTFIAPFNEPFSGGVKPNCWTNSSTNNTGNALWKFTGAQDYAPGNTRTPGTYAWVDGSDPSDGVNDVTLTSPPISLAPLANPQLLFEFFSNIADTNYENNILTVQVYNGSVWVDVFSDNTNSPVWRTATVPLVAYAGTTIQVRFIIDKTAAPAGYAFYNDILLDNVIIQQTPACSAPTSLNLDDTNPFDLTVEWAAASSNPSGYQYELRTSGAAGSGATGLAGSGTATGTSQLIDSLTEDTDYTFYVRSDCGGGLFSDWVSLAVSTIPVPPANDECTGAVSLTVNPDYMCAVTTAGTTVSATQSMSATPCYGNPDDDVWYSFVATGDTHMVSLTNIVSIDGDSTDMYFQVLSGDCAALESEYCSDANTAIIDELTAGDTYYVRVYSYYTSHNTFNICVGTNPGPPANDDCTGAIALTVNQDLNCAVKTSGTTVGAGESMSEAPCYGDSDDDVWFSFVATAETHLLSISDVSVVEGWSTDMYFQVLSGTCDGLDSVLCSDNDSNTATGLTIGETYFVRVYSYYSDSRQNFKICVGTLPSAPANDDCAGAVMLTANPDLNCASITAGTTVGASNSMDEDPCYGNADDDVWYSFVATAETHIISLSNVVSVIGGSTDMYMQVLQGACDAFDSLECSDAESATVENLLPGEIYYIRVYSYGSGAYMNFNICITSVPADPPVNDDCDGAIALTAGATFATSTVEIATNGAATTSSGAPDPGCASYNGGDVWYTVVVPASGSITVETNNSPGSAITDTGLALYSGTCGGTFTLIECDDDDSDDGNFSKIALTNRPAGETIFIRAWEYGGDAIGTFKIAAYDASMSTESFTANKLTHYPNPVKDVLNLSYTSEITSVNVYNMLGQQVIAKKVIATETAIDMSALPDGAYIVNVTSGDNVKTIKVIKNQ